MLKRPQFRVCQLVSKAMFFVYKKLGGFQELQTSSCTGALTRFHVPGESDLQHCILLGSTDGESYLGQVIALELVVDQVLDTYIGARWIAVRFIDVQKQERVVLNAHMPQRQSTRIL